MRIFKTGFIPTYILCNTFVNGITTSYWPQHRRMSKIRDLRDDNQLCYIDLFKHFPIYNFITSHMVGRTICHDCLKKSPPNLYGLGDLLFSMIKIAYLMSLSEKRTNKVAICSSSKLSPFISTSKERPCTSASFLRKSEK